MSVVWNVIDCENQDRDFVDQSQPDYDITGNTWTNTQTPATLTEATTSVTRTSSYSASNTITLDNSIYGDVWGGAFNSTGTERKQSGTPISDFTHKDSSVSLKARGGFSASDGSDADDVLGFQAVELQGSSIDVAMGGTFSASGKGAFRVDELLTAEDGLSLDGLVNTDILAWFGSNSLSISINSSGSSFSASNSNVHDALVGFENVMLSGSLDSDSDSTTMLILGGKTSLSADVTLKEAVNASGVKFDASASAGISVKSIGGAELYDADADAVVGYAHLIVGDGAYVDAAIGGNLDVKLSASGNATVVDEDDTTVVSYAKGNASLSASLKSTGDAAVFGGYTDVGVLAGYQQVSVSGSDVDAIIGGNLSIDVKGGAELADLNTEVIEEIVSNPSLENLTGLLESLQSANLSISVSLKSTGRVDLTSYTPELLVSDSSDSVSLSNGFTEYYANADVVVGYENFIANQGSNAGVVIGGDLSLSLTAKAEGGLDAKLTAGLQSKGQALVQNSDVDVLVGYKTLEAEYSNLGIVVAGNLSLTAKGAYDFSSLLELDPISVSLTSTGSASLMDTNGEALVGYRDVTLMDSSVSVIVGGNVSGDLKAVVTLGSLAFSGDLSLQSKAVGTLTLDGSGAYASQFASGLESVGFDKPMTGTEFALGYQNAVINDSEAGVVIGGNLSIGISADYPSPFNLVGAVSLTSRGQATVSNSSAMALVGYRDLSMTGSSVGVAVGGDISVALGISQEDTTATFGLSCNSKGQASLTQNSGASALIGYQTLSLNASGVDVGVGGAISVNVNAMMPPDDAASLSLVAFLDSQSSATLINGSEADVLIGYRNLNVNASTIGDVAIGGNSSIVASAVLTPVEETENSLIDITAKLSVKAAGVASITNRSTVGTLIGYRTVTIDRNSTAGDIIGGELSGTASETGFLVGNEELNSYLTGLVGGITGGSFDLPEDSPLDGIEDQIVFNGTWKSTGAATVTGGTVEGIFGYSTVTLNYVTVGSANGGNYKFTDAPLSSFDLDDPDTCQVTAAGKLTGTELNIDDITGFKKIQMTGGSVSGAVSATSSATNDWAQRNAVFSALDVDFSGESSLSGYSKVTVDGTYGSTMAMVMTTDGSDTFLLQGNAGLYAQTMLFGAGNDKLQIRGDSTLYADSLDFGAGKDVLDVASGSQLNFYGSNIDGLEKITGKGTVVVTDEALAEALRQLTKTATIVYNPSLAPAGFTSALSQSDAAYNLDAGTALDTLATATTSALFDEEKSSVLGAMIA